jgi:alpha-tubulin suppressor-like RCC1 family protein
MRNYYCKKSACFIYGLLISLIALWASPSIAATPQIEATQHSGFTQILRSDGTIWSAGGGGADTSPVQIGTDNDWASISSDTHTLALKSNGTLWVWGCNQMGEFGNGTTSETCSWYSPIQIGADNTWVKVSTGFHVSLALKSNGTLWAWGFNCGGQLGDGTTIGRHSPVQIGTDTNWVSISAGDYRSVAIKSDGTLWTWGGDQNYSVYSLTPVQVGTDNKWVTVSTDGYYPFALALKSNGTLWAWGASSGSNIVCQLGDGTQINRSSPIQIGNDTNWVSVSAGAWSSMAQKSNGTLWGWGNNSSGELGDGTTTMMCAPTQIDSGPWLSVSSGGGYTAALKADGTFWTWGSNWRGELGDGTTTNRHSPLQIGTDNTWLY